jgi:hypothetical protein
MGGEEASESDWKGPQSQATNGNLYQAGEMDYPREMKSQAQLGRYMSVRWRHVSFPKPSKMAQAISL